MYKLGPLGTRWLKIIHIVLVIFFLGGILSSLALSLGLDLTRFTDVYFTYRSFSLISDRVVKFGAQGIILVGIAYALLTNWGFFRYRWVAAKWIIFIIQTIVGIFVVDRLTTANLALLEAENIDALLDPVFLANHVLRVYVVIAQISLTFLSVVLSVLKPWNRKKKTPGPQKRAASSPLDVQAA